jgi:hypothetical protein
VAQCGSFFVMLLTWQPDCESVGMITNPAVRISIGVGVAVSAALIYMVNKRRKNRSLLVRARRQANTLIGGHLTRMITDSAAGWIAKGREEAARKRKAVIEAMEAGKTAYQKVTG